jgi:hypothetical protein
MSAVASARIGEAQPPRRTPPARRPRGGTAIGNGALARQGAAGLAALRAVGSGVSNRAVARAVCDRPAKSRQGAGEGRERPDTFLSPDVANLVGDAEWQLFNFDIDRSFVKDAHEAYIRTTVVPKLKKLIEDHGAYVMVVGEASTTASWSHNLTLSRNRANCVRDVLERELRAAGVTDLDKLLRPFGISETFSRLRRMRDEVENSEDRLVTIVPVDRDPDAKGQCSDETRTRPSMLFKVKTACGSGGAVKVNIGDVSDPKRPTYRRFRWLPLYTPDVTCRRFKAATQADATYGARHEFRLALRDPGQPWAASDLDGPAAIQVDSGWLFAAHSHFSVKLDGEWSPKDCSQDGGELAGVLLHDGPVFCGEVPQPARDKACDTVEKCTADDKGAPASRFAAHMVRFGSDLPVDKILKKLPSWARDVLKHLSPEGGVALVTIGTLDGPEPRRMRRFVFLGLGKDGDGLDGNVAFDKEATSSEPLSLATGDPDSWTSPSDFDKWVRAKLRVPGGRTNTEELEVGGITFSFAGSKCNTGRSHKLWGLFRGVTSVDCDDIGSLPEPQPDCGEDNCPAEQQLAGHDEFRFKIGRAALSGLPVVGQEAAHRYGCEAMAAYVNIGSKGEDPIYREFVFVGKREGCRFDVGKGESTQKYTFDRQLSLADPDSPLDRCDFAPGKATLAADGTLSVRPLAVATSYSFKLPGAFDATCTGAQEAAGWFLPLDDARCGELPEPSHETTPDDLSMDRCRDYLAAHSAEVWLQLFLLRIGAYDHILDDIRGSDPLLYYSDDLQSLKGVKTVKPAVFVGKNFAGDAVVTFVDMEVVSYQADRSGNPRVTVRFLSEPCSFDMHGNPVFVRPERCTETLPQNGMEAPLKSVPWPHGKPKPPKPSKAPAAPLPEPGEGSHTAALALPGAPVAASMS